MMRMTNGVRAGLLVAAGIMAGVAGTAAVSSRSIAAAPPAPAVPSAEPLAGFQTDQVRFDESTGNKLATPGIPAGWRFVGVSNGEKANSNNLWFQSQTGAIYMVHGFTTHRQFILEQQVSRIEVAPAPGK